MNDGPVERYLDELLAALIVETGGHLRRARRLLAEADAHLWDVLGLLALGAFRVWRRHFAIGPGLPAVIVDTVGATGFGAAGLWLGGLGLDRLVVASGHGAGQCWPRGRSH